MTRLRRSSRSGSPAACADVEDGRFVGRESLRLLDLVKAQADEDRANLQLGVGRDVEELVPVELLSAVDRAVGGPEILEQDLLAVELDVGVKLGDVRPIDVKIVELVAADADGKALEYGVEALVAL